MMRCAPRIWIFVVLIVIPAVGQSAEVGEEASDGTDTHELVADRPDVSESSATVPAGRLQMEAGLDYSYVGVGTDNGLHSIHGLNALGRYGVAEFAEVRLQVPNIDLVGLSDGGQTSFGHASLGAKLATELTDRMRAGVLPFVEVGVETGDVGGGLIGTYAFDVTDSFGLSVNAGVLAGPNGAGDLRFEGLTSLAAGFALTDQWGLFAETFAEIASENTVFFADAGLTFLVAPNLQLDAYVGSQVPEVDVFFGGVGASVLF